MTLPSGGRMDYDTFAREVVKFASISDTLYDNWQVKNHDSQVYLSKIDIQLHADDTNCNKKIEYNVIYNVAYAVPILYFRIFHGGNG